MSGLNNISVDYRPAVELIKPKTNNSNQLLPGSFVGTVPAKFLSFLI